MVLGVAVTYEEYETYKHKCLQTEGNEYVITNLSNINPYKGRSYQKAWTSVKKHRLLYYTKSLIKGALVETNFIALGLVMSHYAWLFICIDNGLCLILYFS